MEPKYSEKIIGNHACVCLFFVQKRDERASTQTHYDQTERRGAVEKRVEREVEM